MPEPPQAGHGWRRKIGQLRPKLANRCRQPLAHPRPRHCRHRISLRGKPERVAVSSARPSQRPPLPSVQSYRAPTSPFPTSLTLVARESLRDARSGPASGHDLGSRWVRAESSRHFSSRRGRCSFLVRFRARSHRAGVGLRRAGLRARASRPWRFRGAPGACSRTHAGRAGSSARRRRPQAMRSWASG
jgi:hypothetical protein